MKYEVKEILQQSYGDEIGINKEVTVFIVEYTDGEFKNVATLEFLQGASEVEVLLKIEDYGRSLAQKPIVEYTFAKSGVIV